MNSVALIGTTVKDAVKDFRRDGQKVYKFRIAVPYNKKKDAFFINVDWETDAEVFIKKGTKLFVKGRLFVKNKDGKDVPKIVAESVDFLNYLYQRKKTVKENKNKGNKNENNVNNEPSAE
ncbi:MAG: single-stranded DNA-binding protein [Sulfurihydrogenibium sp.]|jgi:single-stranded DNA-binding protein|nr:single-stranded DNA-binding protein [Sulfurihydrogenibium sp.]